jgi:hypothetical protein
VFVDVTAILTSVVPTSMKAPVRVASVPGVTDNTPIAAPSTAPAAVNLVANTVVPTPNVVATPDHTAETHTLISTIWLFAGITIVVAAEACVIGDDCAITTWPMLATLVPNVVPVVLAMLPARIGPLNVVLAM